MESDVAFVVMPNHLQGILIINDNDEFCRDTSRRVSTTDTDMGKIEQFGKPTKNSIPTIVRLFKSTNYVWRHVATCLHDYIIRNDIELNRIPQYIIDNPKQWKTDEGYI